MERASIPPVCKICGSGDPMVLYRGPVRIGCFGNLSREPHTVWQCAGCGAGYLPAPAVDYASGEYRRLVDGSDDPEEYYRAHDSEQADKLRMLGTGDLRGTTLMDVGCGAGAFLDVVKGLCGATIGIEPTLPLRNALTSKGHLAFPYCADVPDMWNGKVDLAVSFSVIEHLEDSLGFLRDIRRLLRPGGRLLLSTPNRRDWLLELLPEDYGRFFYRIVHTWYFDADALTRLVRLAGFTDASISYLHRFDVSNAVLWLRDRRPTGLGKLRVAPPGDTIFRSLLEATGRADYLYCCCVNG